MHRGCRWWFRFFPRRFFRFRARARPSEGGEPYFTSMLGLGHSPSIEQLYERLGADGSGYFTPKGSAPNTYRDFKWPADG